MWFVSWAPGGSTPHLLSFTAILWFWYLQHVQVSAHFAFTNSLLWTLFRVSKHPTWYESTTSLCNPFNPGACMTTEAAPWPVASPILDCADLSCSLWPLHAFKNQKITCVVLKHYHVWLPASHAATASPGPQPCPPLDHSLGFPWTSILTPRKYS